MAVTAPAIHPLSLAFAPEMVPPKNIVMKATLVISHFTECSVKEVNASTSETTRLKERAITRIVVNPNKTAGINPR